MKTLLSFLTALKIVHAKQYYLLMRMDKPIGTLLLLWPSLWSLWIAAKGIPDPLILLVFCLGVFIMRSAGCVINDFADRKVDNQVQRTQHRPLTSGKVTSQEALSLFFYLILIALVLVLLLNLLTILLSLVALVLAVIYPFMKRFTHYPQVVLGMAFSWSIPMAFAAITEQIDPIAWWLYILTITWIIAYDTMYAMVDREDDLKVGIKSTAIIFARADKLIILSLQLITLIGLSIVGSQLAMGLFYYLGLIAASGFALYQQWLIKDREPAKCFQAFLNNNWFGMSIFIGIFIHYL
jgi:4-hydroxybenzoate polyprenyltransferase